MTKNNGLMRFRRDRTVRVSSTEGHHSIILSAIVGSAVAGFVTIAVGAAIFDLVLTIGIH